MADGKDGAQALRRGPEAGTKSHAAPTLWGVHMKWVSLVLLVLQTVGVVFAMRLSRITAREGPRYLNTTAVFLSEVLKFAASFLFLCHEKQTVGQAAATVRENLMRSWTEVVKISVPSILYALQNNLLFISLSNLSGAVYQVTYQLKILTTAVLSVLILGKALGQLKWFSLVLLTAGVTLIQWPRGDVAKPVESGNTTVGLLAVLSACVTSGLAGVYLEKILKSTGSSIWLRNMQLALLGAAVSLMGAVLQDGAAIREHGFLQGYDFLVWVVIWLQAVGGLVVAAVLKYADNILKCFGNALSIIFSVLFSAAILHDFSPDLLFALGAVLVMTATALYNVGLPSWLTASSKSKVGVEKLSHV